MQGGFSPEKLEAIIIGLRADIKEIESAIVQSDHNLKNLQENWQEINEQTNSQYLQQSINQGINYISSSYLKKSESALLPPSNYTLK